MTNCFPGRAPPLVYAIAALLLGAPASAMDDEAKDVFNTQIEAIESGNYKQAAEAAATRFELAVEVFESNLVSGAGFAVKGGMDYDTCLQTSGRADPATPNGDLIDLRPLCGLSALLSTSYC